MRPHPKKSPAPNNAPATPRQNGRGEESKLKTELAGVEEASLGGQKVDHCLARGCGTPSSTGVTPGQWVFRRCLGQSFPGRDRRNVSSVRRALVGRRWPSTRLAALGRWRFGGGTESKLQKVLKTSHGHSAFL